MLACHLSTERYPQPNFPAGIDDRIDRNKGVATVSFLDRGFNTLDVKNLLLLILNRKSMAVNFGVNSLYSQFHVNINC